MYTIKLIAQRCILSSLLDCRHLRADIAFLLDTSGSVNNQGLKQSADFVRNIVSHLSISPDHSLVSVLTFANNVSPRFSLVAHYDQQSLLSAISRLNLKSGGGTNTHLGLQYLRETTFAASNRARNDAAMIAIVITDGNSNDKAKTRNMARMLRDIGVNVFAIGVGSSVAMSELNDIASKPNGEHVFRVDNYNALMQITEKLEKSVCVGRSKSIQYNL